MAKQIPLSQAPRLSQVLSSDVSFHRQGMYAVASKRWWVTWPAGGESGYFGTRDEAKAYALQSIRGIVDDDPV